jgi:hypothetical protein
LRFHRRVPVRIDEETSTRRREVETDSTGTGRYQEHLDLLVVPESVARLGTLLTGHRAVEAGVFDVDLIEHVADPIEHGRPLRAAPSARDQHRYQVQTRQRQNRSNES